MNEESVKLPEVKNRARLEDLIATWENCGTKIDQQTDLNCLDCICWKNTLDLEDRTVTICELFQRGLPRQ